MGVRFRHQTSGGTDIKTYQKDNFDRTMRGENLGVSLTMNQGEKIFVEIYQESSGGPWGVDPQSNFSIKRPANFTSQTTVVADLATQNTAGFVSAEDHGTWNPSDSATRANITGTGTYTNPRWYIIGDWVFATIDTITGLSCSAATSQNFFAIQSTGLPGVTNDTQFFGGAYFGRASEARMFRITQSSASNSDIFLGGEVGSGGTISISGVDIRYRLTD